MIIQSKMTDDQLLIYIYKAAEEYKKLINKSFLLIGKNKKTNYYWFECQFEKKNFMHLLGIDSSNYCADDFFDKCDEYNKGIGEGIKVGDCTPSRNHNRTTVNEKTSVCADILRIHEAKYFNIGDKDKILQYVDFTYAYGSDVTLGFQTNHKGSSFPITLIPKHIDTFSTQKFKIIFVYTKNINDTIFKDLIVEKKKGLLDQLYIEFPLDLKKRIEY